MVEDVLRWPTMGETYLEVSGCFGAALVGSLGGVMDFNTVDGFGDWVDFGTRECEGLGGAGALRELGERIKANFLCALHHGYLWAAGNSM